MVNYFNFKKKLSLQLKETRIKSNASRKNLRLALTPQLWQTVVFALLFLNPAEECHRANERELLCVAWSIEFFQYYSYGRQFTVITDHRFAGENPNYSSSCKDKKISSHYYHTSQFNYNFPAPNTNNLTLLPAQFRPENLSNVFSSVFKQFAKHF